MVSKIQGAKLCKLMGILRFSTCVSLACIFVFMLLAGCRSFSPKEEYFNAEGNGDYLISAVLSRDTAMACSFCYLAIGDKLIQGLYGDACSYAVYHIKEDSLQYEGKFLMKGRGPYEMSVARLKYRPDKNELILYSEESSENDFYIVDLTHFNNLYDPRFWKKGRLPQLPTRSSLEFIDESVFLHTSFSKENSLFSIAFNKEGNHPVALNFPYPVDVNESAPLRYTLFTGDLVKHPSRSTFVYSCEFFKYVILFDLVKETVLNVRYISHELPVYKPVSGNPYQLFTLSKESQEGCLDIIATGRCFYLGYNNMSRKDIQNQVSFKGYPAGYYDRINVFDWDGNFIRRLVLDRPIYCFSVSQDDKYLYASSIDINAENQPDIVLRFDL